MQKLGEKGSQLGWEKEFVEDEESVQLYLQELKLAKDKQNRIRFTDVLEEIVILAVIEKEIEEMQKEKEI